jgi:hypothetical protein
MQVAHSAGRFVAASCLISKKSRTNSNLARLGRRRLERSRRVRVIILLWLKGGNREHLAAPRYQTTSSDTTGAGDSGSGHHSDIKAAMIPRIRATILRKPILILDRGNIPNPNNSHCQQHLVTAHQTIALQTRLLFLGELLFPLRACNSRCDSRNRLRSRAGFSVKDPCTATFTATAALTPHHSGKSIYRWRLLLPDV